VSNVAPQALYFLNHPFVETQARAAAQRLLQDAPTVETRLALAFRRTLGRTPTLREMLPCQHYLTGAETSLDAWTTVQQTLFASIDFRYLP
jgi:hypothetical protein